MMFNDSFGLCSKSLLALLLAGIAKGTEGGLMAGEDKNFEALLASISKTTDVGPRNLQTADTIPPGLQDLIDNFDGESSCVFCDSADTFDPELTFANVTCNDWAMLSMFTKEGEECSMLRAAAVKFCGCPTEATATCPLCPNGNDGYLANEPIVFANDITCADIDNMVAVDGDDTCEFVNRLSYFCGCPGVAPTCSLCGQDSNGNQLLMTRPDEVVIPGDPATSTPDTTCADWDKFLSLEPEELYEEETGMTVQTAKNAAGLEMTRCEKTLLNSAETAGVQLDGFCGCPGVEPLNQCSPCGEGYVANEGSDKGDCARLSFVAPFVSDPAKCEFMQKAAVKMECCVEVTNSTETAPAGDDGQNKPPSAASETTSAATSTKFVFAVLTAALAATLRFVL